jgi:COP9 signalosome complex subunit 5
VSQLSDLHQKLAKAQSSVNSTRAPVPTLKEKETGTGTQKVSQSESSINHFLTLCPQQKEKEEKKKEDNQLAKSVKDRFVRCFCNSFYADCYVSTRIAVEAQHGLIAQVIKDVIFSMRPQNGLRNTSQISDIADMAIG